MRRAPLFRFTVWPCIRLPQRAQTISPRDVYKRQVIGRGGDPEDLPGVLEALRTNGNRVRVLFLDASDEVLLRRYEGTRRRHPLAARGVEESIADERRLLAPVRDQADLLIDTGELNTCLLYTSRCV